MISVKTKRDVYPSFTRTVQKGQAIVCHSILAIPNTSNIIMFLDNQSLKIRSRWLESRSCLVKLTSHTADLSPSLWKWLLEDTFW